MNAFATLLLAATVAVGETVPPSAAESFDEGLLHRDDAVAARPFFRTAAAAYDADWNRGPHSPTLAFDRGRAHRLAGNRPAAILAFRQGLLEFPWDADLQMGLAEARSGIDYPAETEPSERLRPDPPGGWRSRVSPTDLAAASALASLALAWGIGRWVTVRTFGSRLAIAGGIVGIAMIAWASVELGDVGPAPAVVAESRTTLRRGNGDSYPPRLPEPLPVGTEIEVIGERGGWLQVRIPGGALGWLPTTACLR